MHHFLALRFSPTHPPPKICDIVAQRLAAIGFEQAISIWGFALFHRAEGHDAQPIWLPRNRGALFGCVFTRGGERLMQEEATDALAVKLAATGGEKLVDEFWGDYVAFLLDKGRGALHAVREPMGARPLFFAQREGLWVMFSHVEDFAVAFGAVTPSHRFLRGFLRDTHFMTSETALEGVKQVEAGARLSFCKDQCETAPLWRPSHFPGQRSLTFEQARGQIREAVESSIAVWPRAGGRVLHRLSGGLDSSILLAVMKKTAPDATIVCVNECPLETPESDERAAARAVAAAAGAELVELRVGAADADMLKMFEAPLTASPTFSVLSYAQPLLGALIAERDTAMMTNGEGGDQLFHRSPGLFAAADAVRSWFGPRRVLNIALDAAHRTGESVWSAFGFALIHGLLRRRYDVRSLAAKIDDPILDSGAEATVSDHSWLDDADRAPPGRGVQIIRLLDAITQATPLSVTDQAQTPLILCSQPIAETCLAIPPHLFIQSGADRSLWRAAFADLLPDQIVRRQFKGATTRYFTALLEANRGLLRDRLLEGGLVTNEIVDRARFETILKRSVWSVEDKHVLLTAICCEAWFAQIARVNAVAPRAVAA